MKLNRTTHRPVVRVGLVTVLVLLVPLVGMQVSDEVDWGVADFVLAAVLLAASGMLLEAAARKPRRIGSRVAVVSIALAAIILGNADDAPGLVLFGCLLILGTVALTVRTALRNG